MTVEIVSSQNPRVKRVLALQQKSRMRKDLGMFVVEGLREVERALVSGYMPEELWACSWENLPNNLLNVHTQRIQCSPAVFAKIAYREAQAGIVGVFKMKAHGLETFTPPANPLYVVVEDVEKPGNLGAILRTCNGLGASALFVCDSQADVYNPNVIRNSLGGFFATPVIVAPTPEVLQFLKQTQVQIASAYLPAAKPYTEINFTVPTALVFGSEAHGLSAAWVAQADVNCIIPMQGIVDSLNVSVAVAIVLAEAVRQRV